MSPQRLRAVGTAVAGPVRWAQRTGFVRSALAGKAVDANGEPLPWYCLAAVDFLSTLDFANDAVLEFGSGQSTLWWAKKAKSVTAVEGSAEWSEYVTRSLSGNPNAKVHLETDLERHADLPLSWDRTFDIVVIDGGDRRRCAETALKVVKPDGLIIFDNSEGYWGPEGTHPILDLLDGQQWMRIDFYGYAPGVLSTSVTSLFFRDGSRFLHLPPPRFGGK